MYTLPVDKQVTMKVSYVDAHGNPAKVDGDVEWTSSDDTIAKVVPGAAMSFKATVQAAGKVGTAQITVSADADLGAGVKELVTLMDVTTVAGEAVAGTITPTGAPTPVPPARR